MTSVGIEEPAARLTCAEASTGSQSENVTASNRKLANRKARKMMGKLVIRRMSLREPRTPSDDSSAEEVVVSEALLGDPWGIDDCQLPIATCRVGKSTKPQAERVYPN
jgi:hypothetical protein